MFKTPQQRYTRGLEEALADLETERSAIYGALAKAVGEDTIESHAEALEWLAAVAEVQRTQQSRIAALEAELAVERKRLAKLVRTLDWNKYGGARTLRIVVGEGWVELWRERHSGTTVTRGCIGGGPTLAAAIDAIEEEDHAE